MSYSLQHIFFTKVKKRKLKYKDKKIVKIQNLLLSNKRLIHTIKLCHKNKFHKIQSYQTH